MSQPFQLFDELAPKEYAALKADIDRRGVQVPIEYDEAGNILDGHHRERACRELGMKEWPRTIRIGMTDEEKEDHVVTLNVRRRHLTQAAKREWAAWFLHRHPEWTDRRVADEVGVDHKTAADVRAQLEATGEIPQLDKRVGKDGKARAKPKPPAAKPSITVQTQGQQKKAEEVAKKASAALPAKPLELKRAERIAREAEAEARRAEPVPTAPLVDDIDLRHGDFRDVLADIEPGTVDAIITDPPYPAEFVPLFGDLGQLAARILKPTGVLAALTGQSHLTAYLGHLNSSLAYRWVGAYMVEGPRCRMHAARVGTGWKPVLLYQRTDAPEAPYLLNDVFTSAGDDKEYHEWGQSESGFGALVERLTSPGALVVDPFLGGGTTAVVCRDLGRRFIGCDLDADKVRTSWERVA